MTEGTTMTLPPAEGLRRVEMKVSDDVLASPGSGVSKSAAFAFVAVRR